MNNPFLEQLINELKNRDGGLVLSLEQQPAAVVLSIEKYNKLMSLSVKNLDESVKNTMQNKKLTVLVTGGAGYIGAHTAQALLEQNYKVIVLDNLSCGFKQNIPSGAEFIEGDLADKNLLRDIFTNYKVDAVMHFAASVEVEESVEKPDWYLFNNATNTESLLSVMLEFGIKKFIFSSTAAVYGEQEKMPINETATIKPNNPYGYSKAIAEKIIKYNTTFSGLEAVIFRYFNACGFNNQTTILPTHDSHLLPNIIQVAKGEKEYLKVFGNSYGTPDGSAVRDYIHVMDIAAAHILALQNMSGKSSLEIYNIGTSKGFSVLELVNAVAEVLGKIIPMEVLPARPGDAAVTVADNTKIKNKLGFMPEYSSLENIVLTAWEQTKNL